MGDEVVDPPIVEPPLAPEPPVPPVVDPELPRKDHWALKRISEESEKARQAQERAAAAERRASEAEALAERLKAGATPATADPRPTPQPQGDRQAEIRAEAARQRYVEDIGEVRARGFQQFGSAFNETISVLSATGVNDEFLADVLAVDKANMHVILDGIAKNPERAVYLAGLSSRQRIAEIAKMTATPPPAADPEPKPAPSALAKKVSGAPAPAPKVTPAPPAPVKDGYADDSTDAEFDAQFYGNWAKRTARR